MACCSCFDAGYAKAIDDAAHLLRNVNTLEKVPGAQIGMPTFNPLWDAAGLIRMELAPDSGRHRTDMRHITLHIDGKHLATAVAEWAGGSDDY